MNISSAASPISRPVVNQHGKRLAQLKARIAGMRASLQQQAQESIETEPELGARIHSLLLFADGLRAYEIAAATGLTESTVRRVRRRFELWGPHCLKDPPPASCTRSIAQQIAQREVRPRRHATLRQALPR